ncbi:MAG: Gfo/Idh/MocA family oxidoreductase [Bacteroidota bacterium]|nr:Gfo/Idh/MocA family oxidoreductase [Flavisolibacter sp.]MBD0349532.1 Gfo/Idh/MocA family oxidoreductase [Flavisolibacter sp.]MBD0365378.1 Gfo/Idh/MocA family oxidoreductase [Flavisolibacter sp.]MBD0376321.1 Gfo/Idh/MocA family oxidoreductase [Flavisolibacter sp.]MDQ3844913.1 Gfo/Idh/MocA family oxidoreductase [Bacteroidota bacterium]
MKVGIFGAGHLGKIHIHNWKEIEGVTIAGFYDTDEQTALHVTDQLRVQRFFSEDDLIAACDVVDIVTPTPAHFAICQKALRMSRHVFVEKPMVHTMEEAHELVKLVQESNIKLQVGHVERFNPAFLAVQQMELHPMFIEVHRLAQFNPRGTEVSVILDLMIHDIDIILSIIKSDVKNISASGVAVLTDTPDIANVRMEFDNGCVVNLTSSRISMKKMRKMRLFQKDAYIGIDFLDKKAEVVKLQQGPNGEGFSLDIDMPQGKKTIAIVHPPVREANAIKQELEALVAAIHNNTRPVVNEIDGLRAMEVAHQILKKINNQLTNK